MDKVYLQLMVCLSVGGGRGGRGGQGRGGQGRGGQGRGGQGGQGGRKRQ